MANCNKLFLDFNKEITPTLQQMQQMKTSREALEDKITKKLREKLGISPVFFTQGSGAKKMKTIIIKYDGTYDADRGIFLPKKPLVSTETVQGYVFDAVSGHTSGGASHRKKCIRVYYKSAYNIDFPVYYEVSDETYSYLAVKGAGWIKDDPEEMIDWFCKRKDENGQLIRIVKYLKAWASKCGCKMPSGIALSVWAAQNFTEDERDDKCLLQTLSSIQSALYFGVDCISPVEPYDDLTSKLSIDQKEKFKKELDGFCNDAQKAIDEPNQLESSKLWRKYFGTRFNLGVDEDLDAKAKSLFSSAAIIKSGSALLGGSGNINLTEGVKHLTHRNYGS